jgi:hypothetical protein
VGENMKQILYDLFITGLSGWIILLIVGGVSAGAIIIFVRTKQSNIIAGGDVAGGNITKGCPKKENNGKSGKKISIVSQKDIRAKGDVAAGDIMKGCK